ncbi:MAG: hypothetical protein AAGC88_11115 [Bacteroidota bacterium]
MFNIKFILCSLLVAFAILSIQSAYGQNSAGINTDTPSPNAVLQLVSPGENQGLLIPSLTNAQILSITNLTNTDIGLLVYNNTASRFQYWDGSTWRDILNQGDLSEITVDGSTILGDGINTPLSVGTIENTQITGLGSAAVENIGTATGDVVGLIDVDGSAGLPAVDGSNLLNVNTTVNPDGTTITGDGVTTPLSVGAIPNTSITGLGTASTLDVGTSANDVVQLSADNTLPILDGSNLTGLSGSVTTDGTTITGDGETTPLTVGTIPNTSITGLGTAAALDVGPLVNNVVQLSGNNTLPALDGGNLTGVTVTTDGTTVTGDGAGTALAVGSVPNTSVTGLGTASTLDAGTLANNVVQLSADNTLPALDGSNLTGVGGSVNTDGTTITGDGSGTPLEVGTVPNTSVSGLGTSSTLDAGTLANNVVQLPSANTLPTLDGSNLTDVTVNSDGTTITGDGAATPLAIGTIPNASVSGLGTAAALDAGYLVET